MNDIIARLWEEITTSDIASGIIRETMLILRDAYLDAGEEEKAKIVGKMVHAFLGQVPNEIWQDAGFQRCFRRACRRAEVTEKGATFAQTLVAFREWVESCPTVVAERRFQGLYVRACLWTLKREGKAYYLEFDRWQADSLRHYQYVTHEVRVPKTHLKRLTSIIKEGSFEEAVEFDRETKFMRRAKMV